MMKLKGLQETIEFQNAKYTKYIDADGNDIENIKWMDHIEVIDIDTLEDNGLLIKLFILNKLPDEWSFLIGAMTQPRGYEWVHNRKTIKSGCRQSTLMRMR